MKLKNVNFFEQHVEKIVIGVMGLVALLILFFFVFGEPYRVKILREEVAPSKVGEMFADPIRKLERELRNPNTPEELNITVAPHTERFAARDDRVIAESPQLASPLCTSIGLDRTGFKVEGTTRDSFLVPPPPAPAAPLANSGFAVLKSDEEIEVIFGAPPLLHLLGEVYRDHVERGGQIADKFATLISVDRPRDFEFVSIMVEFDWEAWQESMQAVPSTDRIPDEWWREQYFVTDVLLERQEWDPITENWGTMVNGEWAQGEVQRIQPLPGALTFRRPIEGIAPTAIRTMVRTEFAQAQISRPPFAPIEGLWLPPDQQPKKLDPKEERKLLNLNRAINNLEKKLRWMDENQERMAEQEARDVERKRVVSERRAASERARGQRAARDRGGAGDAGRRGREAMPLRAGPGDKGEDSMEKMLMQLDEMYGERAVLLGLVEKEELEAAREGPAAGQRRGVRPWEPRQNLGARDFRGEQQNLFQDRNNPRGLPPGRGGLFGGQNRMPGRVGGGPGFEPRAPGVAARGPMSQDNVVEDPMDSMVWAHDLTALPGGKYRYRIRVAVLNPLYQRHERLVEEQIALADELSLESDPSPWTAPISIHPKTYFFLVHGNWRDQEGIFEVYRVFNGRWRREDFAVRPGEPIGGIRTLRSEDVESEIDLSVGAIVVDLDAEARSTINRGRTTVRMLYLETGQDQLMERTVESDKDDATRVHLRNQSELEEKLMELAQQ